MALTQAMQNVLDSLDLEPLGEETPADSGATPQFSIATPTAEPEIVTPQADVPDKVDSAEGISIPDIPDLPLSVQAPSPSVDPMLSQQMGEIKTQLEALKQGQVSLDDTQDRKLAAIADRIRQKYPAVDPSVLEDYKDVIRAVRSEAVAEVEIGQEKLRLDYEDNIQKLRAEMDELKQKSNAPVDPAAEVLIYQKQLAQVIPHYEEVLQNPKFTAMLDMAVSENSPDFTWRANLTDLHYNRRTDIIGKIVGSFWEKHMASDNKGQQVMVPSSPTTRNQSVTGQGRPKVDPRAARDLLQRYRAGEVPLTREHAKKLRDVLRAEYVNLQ